MNKYAFTGKTTAKSMVKSHAKRAHTTIAVSYELNKKIETMQQVLGLAGTPITKAALVADAIEDVLEKKFKDLPSEYQTIYQRKIEE